LSLREKFFIGLDRAVLCREKCTVQPNEKLFTK
jgi:hypothetical protein